MTAEEGAARSHRYFPGNVSIGSKAIDKGIDVLASTVGPWRPLWWTNDIVALGTKRRKAPIARAFEDDGNHRNGRIDGT